MWQYRNFLSYRFLSAPTSCMCDQTPQSFALNISVYFGIKLAYRVSLFVFSLPERPPQVDAHNVHPEEGRQKAEIAKVR